MNKKIIFLDVDGTLVDSDNTMPKSAKQACFQAKTAGHLLCVATGRQHNVIGEDVMSLGFDAVISAGGARVDVGGKTIYGAAFSRQTLAHIISYFESRDIGCTFECSESLVASRRMFEYFRVEQAHYREIIDYYIQLENVVPGELRDTFTDVSKVIFSDIGSLSFGDVQREFEDECEVFRGSMPFYGPKHGELCPIGVHKGMAVEKVLQHYGIPKNLSFAIGDGDNDRAMLQSCGHGIAMGNACSELKAAAEYITAGIQQDGVFKALKHYKLI